MRYVASVCSPTFASAQARSPFRIASTRSFQFVESSTSTFKLSPRSSRNSRKTRCRSAARASATARNFRCPKYRTAINVATKVVTIKRSKKRIFVWTFIEKRPRGAQTNRRGWGECASGERRGPSALQTERGARLLGGSGQFGEKLAQPRPDFSGGA